MEARGPAEAGIGLPWFFLLTHLSEVKKQGRVY
jgi:hypothetical protein